MFEKVHTRILYDSKQPDKKEQKKERKSTNIKQEKNLTSMERL